MDTTYFRILTEDLHSNPAFVLTANAADAPAINAIANGDFSEEPQKSQSELAWRPMYGSAGLDSLAALGQFRFSTD